MSTAVQPLAHAQASSPLSDSLMSMIDQAHAESGDPTSAERSGAGASQEVPKAESIPPTGKAAEATKDTPAESAPISAKDEAKQEPAAKKGEADPVEMFKKRLNEQTAVNSRLGRELKETQGKLKILEQQLAGTYEAPVAPSPEDQERVVEFRGKETASRRIASEKYGDSFVDSQIYDEGAPYRQLIEAEPWHHVRVARADHPVEEALRVLRERKVYEELGPDPDQWERIITEKVRPEIMKELHKQQAATPSLIGKQAPSVSEARGAAEGREPVKVEEDFSLSAIGGHFLD